MNKINETIQGGPAEEKYAVNIFLAFLLAVCALLALGLLLLGTQPSQESSADAADTEGAFVAEHKEGDRAELSSPNPYTVAALQLTLGTSNGPVEAEVRYQVIDTLVDKSVVQLPIGITVVAPGCGLLDTEWLSDGSTRGDANVIDQLKRIDARWPIESVLVAHETVQVLFSGEIQHPDDQLTAALMVASVFEVADACAGPDTSA